MWRCVGPTQGAMLVGFLEYQAAQHVVEGAEAGGPPRRTGTTLLQKFMTIKFINFEMKTIWANCSVVSQDKIIKFMQMSVT